MFSYCYSNLTIPTYWLTCPHPSSYCFSDVCTCDTIHGTTTSEMSSTCVCNHRYLRTYAQYIYIRTYIYMFIYVHNIINCMMIHTYHVATVLCSHCKMYNIVICMYVRTYMCAYVASKIANTTCTLHSYVSMYVHILYACCTYIKWSCLVNSI